MTPLTQDQKTPYPRQQEVCKICGLKLNGVSPGELARHKLRHFGVDLAAIGIVLFPIIIGFLLGCLPPEDHSRPGLGAIIGAVIGIPVAIVVIKWDRRKLT